MHYEVRYQIGGDEHTQNIDAASAAEAAAAVQEQFVSNPEVFELIQVTLLDGMPEPDLTHGSTTDAH